MVGAQQCRNHDEQVGWDDGKGYLKPPAQYEPLELEVPEFASGKDGAGITGRRYGGFDEGGEVTTAAKLVLNAKAAISAQATTPLSIDLALKIECEPSIGDVAWNDEEGKCDPAEQRIDGEESPIVEKDAGPTE